MTPEERDELAARLAFVVGVVNRRLRPPADGLSHVGVSALSSIARMGSVRVGDLARLEGIGAPSMTRLVTELEQRGLVARAPDSDDRRSTRIRLTAPGEDALTSARRARARGVDGLLGTCSDAELAAIADATEALERVLLRQDAGPVRDVQRV